MSHEVELKLALGPDGPDALRRHPRLAGEASRRQTLVNTYYDTPEGDLKEARVALRLRRIGDEWRQTLKTSGQGGGGLSTRGEWEWKVAGDTLDLEGLKGLEPIQALDETLLTRLAPCFTTDFQREVWLVQSDGGEVEIALDEGEIRVGELSVTIREVELELKRGDARQLLELADGFAESVPLRPSDTSKAARGTALAEGWRLPSGDSPSTLLHRLVVALDAYADTQDSGWMVTARETLERLAQCSSAPGVGEEVKHLQDSLEDAEHRPDWLSAEVGAGLLRLGRRLPDNVEME